MTDWQGHELTLPYHEISKGRVVAAANRGLWQAAVTVLGKDEVVEESLFRKQLQPMLVGALLGGLAVALALRPH